MVFRLLTTSTTQQANYGQVNDRMRRLDKEQTTKTYKQAGGNAMSREDCPTQVVTGQCILTRTTCPGLSLAYCPTVLQALSPQNTV